MDETGRAIQDSEGLLRGVETLDSLEAKLAQAIEKVMPGAAPELLDTAFLYIMRIESFTEAGREAERERDEGVFTFLEVEARNLRDETERRLIHTGVAEETLERLKNLYPLAQDLRREVRSSAELEDRHGCAKCRHCFSSWERTRGEPEREDTTGLFCETYGGVPAFCFDFKATRHCSSCGTRVSPKRVAESDPVPVECALCEDRGLAA